jgi:neopullulanase
MNYKNFLAVLFSLIFYVSLFSASFPEKVEPPFWWTEMKTQNLQILVYGENISTYQPGIKYNGITLDKTILVDNPNYLFLYVTITETAKPGNVPIEFSRRGAGKITHTWELKQRKTGSAGRKGFDHSDVIYLLMPDRFANGDPSNDNIPGMLEKSDRKDPLGRHGGDIRGIINHLDYLSDLGITAIWHNPVYENNQEKESYHGYAITDFYNTDKRLGNLSEYIELVSEAEKRGIKIIKDMIFNHCGDNHYWIKDLPTQDWIHQWTEFTKTHYRGTTIVDPNVAQSDLDIMLQGWFDHHMPDLNQKNRLLADYLIQHSIWWIEHTGIRGIRMDTQPYPYKEFMSEWAEKVLYEYPDFSIVGEAWMPKVSLVSYYQGNALNHDNYNSHLPSVFDFPLYYAINSAFNEKAAWDKGLIRLYDVLAEDFLYPDPSRLIVFGDNHDLNRLFSSLNEDLDRLKLTMTFILTTRGIPSIYYGTEILKTGFEHTSHGDIRTNFPGGWPKDKINAFTSEGRTKDQNEAFEFIRLLLNYRKENPVLQTGKLTHFIPHNNLYVYFRSLNEKRVMIVLNSNEESLKIDVTRFSEMLHEYTLGRDILTGEKIHLSNDFEIKAKSAMILELIQ